MANVHPYKGYLNTNFNLYANGSEDISYEIYSYENKIDEPILKGSFKPHTPHSINLKQAGSFQINFSDGTSSEIVVEDGYKFGGSSKKAAFIFDDTPWAFVIMYDRTYFYNRDTNESYIELISPDFIEELSEEYVIFKNKNQTERTIYSLVDQKPILNISNIVYFNDETIIWEEDNNLILYSFEKREIISHIHYIQYTIDNVNRHLIYTDNNKIFQVNLYESYNIKELYSYSRDFLVFLNSSLSVLSSYSNSITQLQVVNHISGEIVKELEIDGCIASINDKINIDTSKRKIAIRNFDLKTVEFPEATIDVIYNDITFYPCDWDIYYVIRTNAISKSISQFKSEEQITLRSINNTNIEQKLKEYDNQVIISDSKFILYNKCESFVNGKDYYGAGYNEGGEIHIHRDMIILSKENTVSTLSRNGYWDNRKECDYDFSKFEKYGVVYDNKNKEYFSLKYISIKGIEIEQFYSPEDYIILGKSIIYAGGNVLFRKSDYYTFSKKPLGISPNHTLGIDIRGNKVYLLSLKNNEESCCEILSDKFDSSNYKQVLLSENADQILYRTEGRTEVKDIKTEEVTEFDNLSYVVHCNGIRPLFQQVSSLQPRIVNPVTGQIIDYNQMKKFQFVSPNGEYYAGTLKDMYQEYYYRDTNEIIKDADYKKIIEDLTYPTKGGKKTQAWKDVTTRRIRFLEKHSDYLKAKYPKQTHMTKTVEKWYEFLIDRDDNLGVRIFVNRVIGERGILIIRKLSDSSEVAKIDLGLPLHFMNYVSFSYDSKYVSLAGYRDYSHGLFLVYDLQENKTLISINTKRAVWLTSFSKKQEIAAYTSNPNTIYFEGDFNCEPEQELERHLILNRNFLTFSPDGEFIALSDQGYVSKYDIDGNPKFNWGHQPSTLVEIRCTKNIQDPIAIYNDLSNLGIADTSQTMSVASVSFSNDNKRLMMVGCDGVVIIRNLYLDENAGK